MFGPFAEGMRELGYAEGHNLILEHTFVDEKYELFPAERKNSLTAKLMSFLPRFRRQPPLPER